MKTLVFAVGIILISAVPVLAGPKAPDQHSTQFHALSGLSQSATPPSLQDKELGAIDKGNFRVMPIELTNAELNAITGGDNGSRGGARGYGYGYGCNCSTAFLFNNGNGRF